MDPKLMDIAQRWANEDPDPEMRDEVQALIERGDHKALQTLFESTLKFGTAGLRAPLGAGPMHMNRAVVIRTTAGLCNYLKSCSLTTSSDVPSICIGYDGRTKSHTFSKDALRVVLGAGLHAYIFDEPIPTPLLAFALLETESITGIMITASHNPAEYNGYKVFAQNGAQIIPPQDQEILKHISAIESLQNIPMIEPDSSEGKDRWNAINALQQKYIEQASALRVHPECEEEICIAYTALHGVGNQTMLAALSTAGFSNVHTVKEQAEPNAAFPNLTSPNPEDEATRKDVYALADKVKADLVLLNDPDADRLAVSLRDHEGIKALSGNEIGCLLADYLLAHQRYGEKALVLSSIVSSSLVARIAEHYGAHWEATLTGHKWIHNRALELESKGFQFVFGFEEALGYAATTFVRDKDGISSAVLIADLAAWNKQYGRSLIDARNELWIRHGVHLSQQLSISTSLPEEIDKQMQRFRRSMPKEIAGYAVLHWSDFETGAHDHHGGLNKEMLLPKSNLIAIDLEGEHRLLLRPSGTEPKLKYYIEAKAPVASAHTLEEAYTNAQAILKRIAGALKLN